MYMALFPIMNIIYTIKTIYSINLNCFCCHCPFDISVGVGAFVIGLSQISSFLSLSRRLDSCPPSPPPFCVNLVLLATLTNILESKTTGIVSDYTKREISCNTMLKSDDLHLSPCTALFCPFYHFVRTCLFICRLQMA